MGFGKQLEAYRIPEWKAKYINYVGLKKWLRANIPGDGIDKSKENQPVAKAPTSKALIKNFSRNLYSSIGGNSAYNSLRSLSSVPRDGPAVPARGIEAELSYDDTFTAMNDFHNRVDADIVIIEEHFNNELNVFVDRLIQIKHELDNIRILLREDQIDEKEEQTQKDSDDDDDDDGSSIEASVVPIADKPQLSAGELNELKNRKERLAKTLITIWDCFEKLEDYQKMNLIGAAKLFIKRDRIWGINGASQDFLPFRRRLNALTVPEETSLLMRDLHSKASKEADLDLEEALHVQRAFQKEAAAVDQDDSLTYYFLGVLTVLVVDVFILFMMSPTNPEYRIDIAMTWVMPIWRLCGVVCFFTWTLAFTIRIWERYLVNYKFIMDLDPGCTLDSTDIVGLASVQTTAWSLGMIFQLADYKFGAFGTGTFWGIHAVIQLIVQFIVIPLWPAKEFHYEYRLSILIGAWNCLKACYKVPVKATFWDTLIGDMLTSLVKPMLDIFVISSLLWNQDFWNVPETAAVAIPLKTAAGMILAVAPLWIRIQQTREKLHSNEKHPEVVASCRVNIIKFCCSILVVVVTNVTLDHYLSPYTTRLSWVVTYIMASLMALYWDMHKDWGLAANPDTFLREGERILFPQYMYMNVVIIDVLGRLTWALTLMPTHVLGKNVVEQQIVVTVTTLIEVIRRNAWFLVKIEHEHLTNSNKHRALLWVPKVNAQKDESIRELHRHINESRNHSASLGDA